MTITWGDIKKDVYNESMLEASEYSDYEKQIVSAANYALIDLAKDFPEKNAYEITQTETEGDGYNEYDIITLTQDETEGRTFQAFANPPVLKVVEGGVETVNDYKITLDRYLFLNKSNIGTFKVMYEKYPSKLTESTPDNYQFNIDTEVLNAAKLCMIWKIMYEDDRGFATQKFNEYMNAKESMRRKSVYSSGIQITEGVDI